MSRIIYKNSKSVYGALIASSGVLFGSLHGLAGELLFAFLDKHKNSQENMKDIVIAEKSKGNKLYSMGHVLFKNSEMRCSILRSLLNEIPKLYDDFISDDVKKMLKISSEYETILICCR